MTMEERTPTTEERLTALEFSVDNSGEVHAEAINDIGARLMKLEALLSDRHVIAALEGMSREGWIRALWNSTPTPAEDGTAPIDAKTPGGATPEERTPTRIGAREDWLRELLGEVAEEADTKRDGVRPIVVRLTGDAAKDAAALEAANAKRAEVEIATGRAPGLIVFDP